MVRFLRSTNFGVHILHLDDFQFSSVEKFQSNGLQEQQSQLFGLSCWFFINNHVWPSALNYMISLNVIVLENFKRFIFCTK